MKGRGGLNDRGVLLEVRGNKGIVMTPDGRFETVPVASTARAGDEIVFPRRTRLMELFAAPAPRRRPGVRAIAAALILGLMLALVTEAVRVRGTAVAYVEVDINPVVELGINRYNRVISVEGLDEDGREVVKGLDLANLELEEAVESIAGVAQARGYVDPAREDHTVLITVTPAEGASVAPEITQRAETAREAVSKRLESNNVRGTVQVIHTAPEVRQQAQKLNLPRGRLALMLKAKEKGIDVFDIISATPVAPAAPTAPSAPREDGGKSADEDPAKGGGKGTGKDTSKGAGEGAGREPAKGTGKSTDAARPGGPTGKGAHTGEGAPDGEDKGPGNESGSALEVKRSVELEEIIKDAREEKDWRRLIEKFGEEIKKQIKAGEDDKRGPERPGTKDGERKEKDDDKKGTNSRRPQDPRVFEWKRPSGSRSSRSESIKSVWERWTRGVREARFEYMDDDDAGDRGEGEKGKEDEN